MKPLAFTVLFFAFIALVGCSGENESDVDSDDSAAE
jgi:hypothetical protein